MQRLEIDLGERSYPITIGRGLLGAAAHYAPHIAGRQVMIVTNETVAPLYLAKVEQALGGYEVRRVMLKDGEKYKTLGVCNQVFDALLGRRFSRDCTLLALGGGVIGDLAGFAAACYQRGVDFIQVPTTLLAQVDSSVGGKTGVNHRLGKNMIGAFYQPRGVIADTDTLLTLRGRQFRSGLAEVIKYALIRDPEFFVWLEDHIQALGNRDADALEYAIVRSCQHKAEVVEQDEREAGLRALLNLGHTFGHALERAAGYGHWLHGEAVAVGMCLAADLSRRMGWLEPEAEHRIIRLIRAAGLPTRLPKDLRGRRLVGFMENDKKVIRGELRLVLLKGIGQALVTSEYPKKELIRTLGER